MNSFKTTTPSDITDNVFKLISRDWMLVTAGGTGKFNTMTASWGGLGHLWNRDVCFIFIRPSRHTFSFLENNTAFTLSFFTEEYRSALKLCGAKSGRDIDKVKETGLTPVQSATGNIYFSEARLVIECGKIYRQDISPEFFLDPGIASNYSGGDYHRLYIGEIKSVLTR
ncbi:MAG TPA: flavin reductase [Spirochaetota bacterium]|nr:flavin reductase [Spirochaetota bacterium]